MSPAELLQALATNAPEARALALLAAEDFLAVGLAADAMEVLRGGPHWADAALRLAEAQAEVEASQQHAGGAS